METKLVNERLKSVFYDDSIDLVSVLSLIESFQSELPKSFLFMLRNFSIRNALPVVSVSNEEKEVDYHVCSRCLRAYIFKSASLEGISPSNIIPLIEHFQVSLGHEGFYLDAGKVISADFSKKGAMHHAR